jgi:hypothetical protein
MRPWIAPAAAATVSLLLSLSTVGRSVYWQDSGFFLAAVHDAAVLYPHGFVLYELLCKGWTLALFFVDFTLAVHLFSSVCAALAAGALALAARDLLRARSPGIRVFEEDPGWIADWAGAAAGMLAAAGYTFWLAGIYAKGYALFNLILAALLWRMVRAAESGRPRDFTIVAVLIGLAWQGHPSAAGAGLALLAFVARHRGVVGGRGLAGRTGLAAAVALGPLLLLPMLDSGSPVAFGEPSTAGDLLRYATGARFVGKEGAFDSGGGRWGTASQYFWEEFLGVGLALVTLGAIQLARSNGRLLLGLLLWAVPYTILATVFALEGQQDHWYVAAWMPLHLAGAVGLGVVARKAAARGRIAVGAAGAAALAWAVGANYRDLDLRGYDLAERFGRLHLEPLAREAVLVVTSDDSSSTTLYLQRVRGVRLGEDAEGRPGAYDRRLAARDPRLRVPDYGEMRRRFPRAGKVAAATAAYVNANASLDRAVYVEEPPPAAMLRADLVLVPAGPLWRVAPKGSERLEEWPLSPEPEAVRPLFRRARGGYRERTAKGLVHRSEPYERRLFVALLRARLLRAEWHFRKGEMARAAELYGSIVRADPETALLEEVIYPLGVSLVASGKPEEGERQLWRALEVAQAPEHRAGALLHLGDLARSRGQTEKARQAYAMGLQVQGLDPALREELRRRLAGR